MAKIDLSDFEAKFENKSDILHDAIVGSFAAATKVMTQNGLQTYLDGAYALHAMGKGDDMVISFLEETPMVVKEVGEDIIPDIVMSVMKMASQTSATILSLLLAAMPTVVERMNDITLIRGFLRLMERMVALAPRGMRPMLSNIDEITAKLTLGGMRRFVMYGAETFHRDFKAQIAYFGLESAEGQQILEQERRGTLFVDNARKLQFYLRAFYNRDFFLRPTAGDYETREGLKPYIEGGIIYIPDAYDDYKQGDEIISGTDIYKAVCAHIASHIVNTTKSFEGDEINQLQQACIGLIEDLRVDLDAIKRFPGLKTNWLRMHPKVENLGDYHPFIADLVDLSTAVLDKNYQPKQSFNAEFRDILLAEFNGDYTDAEKSFYLGLRYYEIVKKATDVTISASSLTGIPIIYRDDNRYIWEFSELDLFGDGGNDYVPASQRQVRKTVSVMEMVNEIDCELAGDDAQEIWTLETELFPYEDYGKSYNEMEGKEPISEPYHYNEWDYRLGAYRPNWVTLYERRIRVGESDIVDGILKEHKGVANRLKNAIDELQPQGLVKFKKQLDGSELDIDACVEAITDIKMGVTPSDRIYIKNVQHTRDVAVNLLMDLSESTNENVVGSELSILELMRQATVLLSWAIDNIGDNLAISGFASDSRHDVQYFHFKKFGYALDGDAYGRIANMRGGLSTRMGAAIRHAGADLLNQSAAKKIMLVLTDGEPADIDVDDPQHLRVDTKKAIEELRAKGIVVFCISLDPYADEYVSRIFGSNRYMVIDNVEKLPERLPQLFISLTK